MIIIIYIRRAHDAVQVIHFIIVHNIIVGTRAHTSMTSYYIICGVGTHMLLKIYISSSSRRQRRRFDEKKKCGNRCKNRAT